MRLFLMTAVAAFSSFATVMLANEALAVQDTLTTMNGVEMVCTGVGSAKDDPRWSGYPVKIVLATPGSANPPMGMSPWPRATRPWWTPIVMRHGSCSGRLPGATPPLLP